MSLNILICLFICIFLRFIVAAILINYRKFNNLFFADIKDTVTFLTITPCGKYLIVADPMSNISAWKLNDNWVHQCTLPRYRCAPTALGVQPSTQNLLIVYADHKVS